MEEIKSKFLNKNKDKYISFKEENKRKLNILLNDVEFIENNNYLLRLLKKSEMVPDKNDLFNRERTINNITNKKNVITNNTNNDNIVENTIEHNKKNKVQLTYELDDLLYNHSKSFSKSKKKYYKIKKENDEFLAFYNYNKNNKSNTLKLNQKYFSFLNKEKYKNLNKEDHKNNDPFNSDNYLLMNDQNEIYFHFLFQSINDRKNYTQQKPYKYIAKIKRYLNNKSFDEENMNESSEQNKIENYLNLNEKEYIKTEVNFYNIKDKIKSKNNKIKKLKSKYWLNCNSIEKNNKLNNYIRNSVQNNNNKKSINNLTHFSSQQLDNKIFLNNSIEKLGMKDNINIYYKINKKHNSTKFININKENNEKKENNIIINNNKNNINYLKNEIKDLLDKTKSNFPFPLSNQNI